MLEETSQRAYGVKSGAQKIEKKCFNVIELSGFY